MDEIDRRIAAALSAEDRAMLDDLREPGFYSLAFGTLRGRNGWVSAVLLGTQTVMFLGAVWAGWRFYAAAEVLEALRWGLTAAVLAVVAVQIKMALVPQMQADRVLIALRRVELMLARRG